MLRTNATIVDRLAIYFNIGVIHRRNRNLKEAQEAWEHALIQEGSTENLADVHSCLGELAYDRGQYEQAEIHHQKALQFINQSPAKEEIKQKLKRKYDQFIQLTDQIDENLKKKRQRTTDSDQPTGH
jgi:tetratricopeptide (TPR) repeat protein